MVRDNPNGKRPEHVLKTLPVKMETVSMDTGKVEKTETAQFKIMPPRAGLCAICAHDHAAADPHNCQSMYYQYAFYAEFGRWPTWADALAHCALPMRAAWRLELQRIRKWSEPPAGFDPIAHPYAVQQ